MGFSHTQELTVSCEGRSRERHPSDGFARQLHSRFWNQIAITDLPTYHPVTSMRCRIIEFQTIRDAQSNNPRSYIILRCVMKQTIHHHHLIRMQTSWYCYTSHLANAKCFHSHSMLHQYQMTRIAWNWVRTSRFMVYHTHWIQSLT